jgi:hypothetical protein
MGHEATFWICSANEYLTDGTHPSSIAKQPIITAMVKGVPDVCFDQAAAEYAVAEHTADIITCESSPLRQERFDCNTLMDAGEFSGAAHT